MADLAEKPQKKVSPLIVGYNTLGDKAAELKKQGASFRLISALMGTSNYNTIYKSVLEHSDDMEGCGKARPSLVDQDRIMQFEKAYPEIAREMRNRKIPHRRWCSYYGFMKEGGGADVSVLTPVNIVKMYPWKGREVQPLALLKEDFPEAFGLKPAKYGDITWQTGYPKYSFARIDPSLYEKSWMKPEKSGKFQKICSNEEMGVFVLTYSAATSKALFSKRIAQEINIRRMDMMLEMIGSGQYTFKGLEKALQWLPTTEAKLREEKKKSLANEARFMELDSEEDVLRSEYTEITKRVWVKNEDEARKAYILNRIKEIKVEKRVVTKEWFSKKKEASKISKR